jgi:hypothetical protein
MVRIIGRIDLADEVHRALGAAGIESNVVTAGPTAAAAASGEDGSVAVVVQDLGMCGGIKRKARHRPVVMVTTAKDERRVLANMRGASGPDAHVVWPASGDDLRAAVARAVAAADTVRPRVPRGQLPSIGLFLVGAILFLGGLLLGMLGSDRPTADALNDVGTGLLGAGMWLGATYSDMPGLYRFAGGAMLLGAALKAIPLVC